MIDMIRGCVLVADSHPALLEGFQTLLSTIFELVVMVSDGPSLFAAAEKLHPRLTLIEGGLKSPAGISVLREFKMRLPEAKFLVISTHEDNTYVQEALAEGALGFVLKRTAADDLLPAVRMALRGEVFVSPIFRNDPNPDRKGR